MATIQRQSILSTIVIFTGFGFGALNLIILQKWLLTTEQWGLTRVVTEAAILMANFACFGSPTLAAKFLPFYRRYLPAQKNDLPFVTLVVFAIGMSITMALLLGLQPQIIKIFGKNNTLFGPYYGTLLLFVLFQGTFLFMEMHAWFSGKTVLANVLKELVFRMLTTVCLLLIAIKMVAFNGFMWLFSFTYLPGALILIYVVRKQGNFPIHTKISALTRRLKAKMFSLASFVFLTTVSNIAFVVCDTLFLAARNGLSQAGIYAVAQYFAQVVEVPMRSMQTSSVPLVSEYWRAKNMVGLASIYKKSCINLLLAGMGIGGLIIVNIHNIGAHFGEAWNIMLLPLVILVLSRWINLGTGLNSIIIQFSTFWRFDFFSTLIYSVIGIPLNFLLIRSFGMLGAAFANLTAMFIYNLVRFLFIYYKFKLQPFSSRNLWLLLSGSALIGVVYFIPGLSNPYIDGLLRSVLFLTLFVILVLKGNFSDEFNWLWQKWSRKLLGRDVDR